MSSNGDGGNSDDAFCSTSGSAEIPQQLSQHAAVGGGAASAANLGGVSLPPQLLWPNQLLGTQFMHPQQQQQAHFNEFLYNMHPHAYSAPPGQPETYSVLPMGHGNFLKVYHCPENTAGGLTTDGTYQHHQPQQQFQQPQHHLPQFHHHHMQPSQPPPPPQQQQQAQPPIFNSYELFSSSTQIMPTPEHVNTARDMPTPKSQPQTQPQVQPAPLLILNNHAHNIQEEIIPEPTQTQIQAHGEVSPTTTTNMIINKLVNNWSPNVTGGTYSQFGCPLPQVTPTQSVISNESQMSAQPTLPELIKINNNNNINGGNNSNNSQAAQLALSNSESANNIQFMLQQQQQTQPNMPVLPIVKQHKSDVSVPTTTSINYRDPKLCAKATANVSATAAASSSAVPLSAPILPEVKKRIVAEVKPMRMTYSDVLSKFNNQQAAMAQTSTKQNGNGNNGKPIANATQLLSERRAENKNDAESLVNGSSRRLMNGEESNGSMRLNKKSPTHENKENVQQQMGVLNGNKAKRNINNNNTATNSNNVGAGNSNSNGQQKQTQKSCARGGANDINNSISSNYIFNTNNNSKKRNSTNNRRTEDVPAAEGNKKVGGGGSTEKNFNAYYNVTGKHNSNDSYERVTKTNTNNTVHAPANSVSNANSRKASSNGNNNPNSSNKSSSAYYSNASASYAPNQQRTRYSNSLSNASSYLYYSKRQRGNNLSSSAAAASNRNYELAKKFLHAWYEYTLKILTWLFYLVYDIVVLGFSMVYERLSHAYVCGLCYVKQLRRELQQNSNKPGLWVKNYWRRFDARFKKNSNWAFWRRFYKKKPPEPPTENFKSGRLPQTGDEAMYSLLNCKGKDAYSILGVPPDSSQEQIRKHYKKIAVLVHPDKNKQAGAEEAFKVLQRAFELIGAPENRLAYDHGLAEALHAEKAWTELHDLLSQLQTKITEAANTIRCSTCGLRHPRKVTDRPHYAARECASCKIRHSAREGDIWAETSFLGLRWKYLALMEGKVYDITEWANCQKGALSHLEPNSHMVQYRIVRGAQQQQQQQHAQQQQSQQAHHSPHHGQQYHHPHGSNTHHERVGSSKYKRDMPPSEASLHDFLDNLYGGQHPSQAANSARRRTRRN